MNRSFPSLSEMPRSLVAAAVSALVLGGLAVVIAVSGVRLEWGTAAHGLHRSRLAEAQRSQGSRPQPVSAPDPNADTTPAAPVTIPGPPAAPSAPAAGPAGPSAPEDSGQTSPSVPPEEVLGRVLATFTPQEQAFARAVLDGMSPEKQQAALAQLEQASPQQLSRMRQAVDGALSLPPALRSEVIADLQGRLSPAEEQALGAQIVAMVQPGPSAVVTPGLSSDLSSSIAQQLQRSTLSAGEGWICTLGGGDVIYGPNYSFGGCIS